MTKFWDEIDQSVHFDGRLLRINNVIVVTRGPPDAMYNVQIRKAFKIRFAFTAFTALT